MLRINNINNKLLFLDDFYCNVNAYYYKEWNNYSSRLHEHNHMEIMYIISGSCVINIKNKDYSLKKGEFVLINANIIHQLIVGKDKSCRMMNIEFYFSDVVPTEAVVASVRQLAQVSEQLSHMMNCFKDYIILNDTEQIYYILKSIIMELDNKNDAYMMMVNLTLSQLLLKIAQLMRCSENINKNQSVSYINKATQYIHSHYADEDISVSKIANTISISPAYMQRLFKRNIGKTVVEFLTDVRIEKAKMFLETTEIPITQIGEYVGISSVQYFDYIFKKNTGLTPNEYRKSKDIFVRNV